MTTLYWVLFAFVASGWLFVMVSGSRQNKVYMNVVLVLGMLITYWVIE